MDQHEALVKRATHSLRVTTAIAVIVCLLQIRMRPGTLFKATLLVNDTIEIGTKHSTHFSVAGWRS